jgi:hypothetical protein
MERAVVRSRLLVRLAGLALAGMTVGLVGDGFADAMVAGENARYFGGVSPLRADNADTVSFYFWKINLRAAGGWVMSFGVPTAAFLVGTLLVCRGSRWVERRLPGGSTKH